MHEDGRGPSIWDTFSHTPGRVKNGDTGDIACDHYHRWREDLDLISSLGVDAYRFSIAWPRLFPTGHGRVNQAGLDFYDRLIDGCLERNIKTFATLYHWDLPQALADAGGWANRSTGEHFANYARVVAEKLGDRLDSVTTFNEPWCSAVLGHLAGVHAPGNRNMQDTLAVIHGQHRAHGLAVQAIREVKPNLPVGIVLNVMAVRPASSSDADAAAAKRHDQFHNGLFLDPLFNGNYPQSVMDKLGEQMPRDWQSDLATIEQPLDFWGFNYYTPAYISDSHNAQAAFPNTRSVERENVERTDIGWEIDASALEEALVSLYSRYKLPPCYITENGAAFNEGVVNDTVNDKSRIDYLESHLAAAHQAISKDVPLLGYFAWSLMDNFEWAEGYSMRFGIVHVDYDTQARTLKDSAKWYRDFVTTHRNR